MTLELWAIEWNNPDTPWALHEWKRMKSIPPQPLIESLEIVSGMISSNALNHLQFRIVNIDTGEEIPGDIF